jgi:hypothetical protein
VDRVAEHPLLDVEALAGAAVGCQTVLVANPVSAHKAHRTRAVPTCDRDLSDAVSLLGDDER